MYRLIQLIGVIATFFLGILSNASAQPFFPPHPLAQVGMHPALGPICFGVPGLGQAPCQAVQQHLQIDQRAKEIYPTLSRLPPLPGVEMCNGPMGPGQCFLIARWMATNQLAQQQIQLAIIGNVQGVGPICAGPLGPGPCEAVRMYLMNASAALPPPMMNLQQVQVSQNLGGDFGPLCLGAVGQMPCSLLGQAGLDNSGNQPMPTPGSFGLPPISGNGRDRALQCAQVAGLDINIFAGCMGQQIVLPENEHAVLDCAVRSDNVQNFAQCAAPKMGIQVSDEQRTLANCAFRTKGDAVAFANCAGNTLLARGLGENERAVLTCAQSARDQSAFVECAGPHISVRTSEDQLVLAKCALQSKGGAEQFATCAGTSFMSRSLGKNELAIINCASSAGTDSGAFATCAAPSFLGKQEQAVLECAVGSPDLTSFGTCAAPNAGIKMSKDQRIATRCAFQAKGDADSFAACAASAAVVGQLGQREQAVLNCAGSANGDKAAFAGCAAQQIFGDDLSKEQQIALRCAAESGGDPMGMASCAGGNLLSLQMSPEQQIIVQCVAQSGGQPKVAAGCMASRLTLRELSKCMTDGMGGKGCFGDSNDIVGKNGWTRRTLAQISSIPGSLIPDPTRIWSGDLNFILDPTKLFNAPKQFVPRISGIGTGPGSVFHTPGQVLSAPKKALSAAKKLCGNWC